MGFNTPGDNGYLLEYLFSSKENKALTCACSSCGFGGDAGDGAGVGVGADFDFAASEGSSSGFTP